MIRDITPQELHERLRARPRPRLVDVRDAHELTGELGHIEGIEHVPLATVPDACARWAAALPTERRR